MDDPPWAAGFETQHEERRATLPVEGRLPGWLEGTYLANGPGQFEVGGRSLCHWFDPLAMLRRFRFEDGRVAYAARYVRSRDFAFARERGRVRTPFPGTPPDRPLPTRLWQVLAGAFPDNPVIGVARMGGEHLAVTESPWGLAVDPRTLETLGRRDLTAGLDCDLTLGHLHHAPDESAFYGLGASYGRRSGYTLFRRPDGDDGPGGPETLARLRFEEMPYVHSFALTERYAVVSAPPFGTAARALLAGAVTGGTFLDAFRDHGGDARFVVLDRETGAHVATVEADPFFVYHHANAYETDGGRSVVVDCVAYPDERAVTALTLDRLRSPSPDLPRGDLVRFRLPLAPDAPGSGARATRTTLREGPMEFPTIHYRRYNGRPYRHAWVAEAGEGPLPARLARVDTRTGDARTWAPGADASPGEPVFVPRPDPAGEADGVVLSVVLDPRAGRSTLVVLDADRMTELARAPLPHRLPYAFHGQFYGPADPGRSVH